MRELIKNTIVNLELATGSFVGRLELSKPSLPTMADSLVVGDILIRTKNNIVCITNKCSKVVLVSEDEDLIGSWRLREPVLLPAHSSLFVAEDHLEKVFNRLQFFDPDKYCNFVDDRTQEADSTKPNYTPQATQTLTILPCPTIGAGEAYRINHQKFYGWALLLQGQIAYMSFNSRHR